MHHHRGRAGCVVEEQQLRPSPQLFRQTRPTTS
nr:MAG TPA: hypothetical protein [Caudoviricetes sp.]